MYDFSSATFVTKVIIHLKFDFLVAYKDSSSAAYFTLKVKIQTQVGLLFPPSISRINSLWTDGDTQIVKI
jgi:hypothetical protein